jgi:hypothetical protein
MRVALGRTIYRVEGKDLGFGVRAVCWLASGAIIGFRHPFNLDRQVRARLEWQRRGLFLLEKIRKEDRRSERLL